MRVRPVYAPMHVVRAVFHDYVMLGEPLTIPSAEEDWAGRTAVAEHAAMLAERRSKL